MGLSHALLWRVGPARRRRPAQIAATSLSLTSGGDTTVLRLFGL
jgi:hypothetical protein